MRAIRVNGSMRGVRMHGGGMRGVAMAAIMVIIMTAAWSCSSIDCPVQNIVSTQYSFANAAGQRDTLSDTLTISTVRRGGTDSILLNRSVMTTDFSLPISYTAPADTLRFMLTDTLNRTISDTVVVAKTNTPHFESVDCNISFFHEITGVTFTRHFIDTIIVRNKSVNYDTSILHFNIVRKNEW